MEYKQLVAFDMRQLWQREAARTDPSGRYKPCPFEHLGIGQGASLEEIEAAWRARLQQVSPRDITDEEFTGDAVPADLSRDQLMQLRLLKDARGFAQYVVLDTTPAPEVDIERAWKTRMQHKDPTGELRLKPCPFEQLGLDPSLATRKAVEAAYHRLRIQLRPMPWSYVSMDDRTRLVVNDAAREFAIAALIARESLEHREVYQHTEVQRVRCQAALALLHREARTRFGVEWRHPDLFAKDAFSSETLDSAVRRVRFGQLPNGQSGECTSPSVFLALMHLYNDELARCFPEMPLKPARIEPLDIQQAAQRLFDHGLTLHTV